MGFRLPKPLIERKEAKGMKSLDKMFINFSYRKDGIELCLQETWNMEEGIERFEELKENALKTKDFIYLDKSALFMAKDKLRLIELETISFEY